MIWVVTAPGTVPGEASILYSLFSAGLETLLLRKPGWSAAEYELLLQSVPPGFRNRIMLAGYPELVEPYGLKGLHLSEQLRAVVPSCEIARFRHSGFVVSTSVHAMEEPPVNGFGHQAFEKTDDSQPAIHGNAANRAWPEGWDHLILGPVFDSISKPGYTGRHFSCIPANAVGIGGITPTNTGKVKQLGFRGAALLGAIWQEPSLAVEIFIQAKESWNG